MRMPLRRGRIWLGSGPRSRYSLETKIRYSRYDNWQVPYGIDSESILK